MAVTWSWKKRIGSIYFFDEVNGKYKVNIYAGNCLGVLIFEYKSDNKNLFQFYSFWNDEEHLKNILGLTKKFKDNIYKNCLQLKINGNYEKHNQIIKHFIKAKIPVNVYFTKL